jgi:twitching motility two-component system response regulator PilH
LFNLTRFLRPGRLMERRSAPRQRPRPGTRVLIVDDSRTVVAALRRMLQQGGYNTLEAYDAESAIAIARDKLPNLIFMDVVLPGMNGFQATRILSRAESTARIPIIVMSGNEQATEQFWVLKIGAADFMKKPFRRRDVFDRLERLLPQAGVA